MANPSKPYYSTDPRDPRVHHVFSDCPNGEQIDPKNFQWGDVGLPLCGTCENMGG
jgi:hypothetical protein